ncbi:MAG TPA: OsmC family protein [Chloroflexia bacterium]|nr:OsmC family protein [Chloroflexia bacterium]
MDMETVVQWDKKGHMRFTAAAPDGFTVVMDAVKAAGGNEEGFFPKALLLVSLGGCTAMDVLPILRKMRQDVTDYRLEIKGTVHEEHPRKFDKIIVEHVLTGHNLSQEMVDKAIQLSHDKYCSVSASLKDSVEVVMTSRLIEAAPTTEAAPV